MFVGELKNDSASYELMGCPKQHPMMKEFLDYLQKEIITDFTSEPKFVSKISVWLNYNVKQFRIHLICGKQLGTKKKNGKPVQLEELMSTDYVEKMKLKNILGIYIPQQELLQRIQYGWFIRMSPRQVLESNTFIGKMLLIQQKGTEKIPYFSVK